MPILVEAAVATVASARMAESAGAGRIELCSDLVEGGVTPSLGLVEQVLAETRIPVHVLIRPRGGDFLYAPPEGEVMLRDIGHAKAAGAHGIVVGALRPDGTVDAETTRRLIDRARPMSVTFHRAFDLSREPFEALAALMELGIDRLLTSGQARDALAGTATIAGLVRRAAGRMVIMAGGGINEKTVDQVIRGSEVREIHVGASGLLSSAMQFRREGVFMGKSYQPDEFTRMETSPERLRTIVARASS